MRGLGRLRRLGRRCTGRLRRAPRTPRPEALLADAGVDADALQASFRSVHGPEALAAIVAAPGADRGLRDLAAGALAGRLPFLDHTLADGPTPDWRRVPGGRRWPRLPAAAYDHGDFTAYGDVRLLWELGRLQVMPTLCAAALLADAAEPVHAQALRAAAFAVLTDFRERNPVGHGPHWIAGLESGLRIFSLLWTWQLLPADGAGRRLLAAALLENGRFTASHLSEKAIANNHLLGEAAALYCLGCALPVLDEAAAWRARGLAILERELPLQLLPDGVLAEQAVEYHRFVLEFMIQALLWGRAADDPAVEAFVPRLTAMLAPLDALTGPDGRLVALGDDDSGRVLRLDDRHRRDARGLLALGARLLAAPLPAAAGDCDGEALWLAGAALAAQAPAAAPPAALRRFSDAGWYAARWEDGHLVFKAGPMGRGGAGHGHADALALTLALDGRPLLLDPGTYLYNGPQRWRDHFRGARAHNLLRVGGRDPARPHPAPDRFGWAERCAAELVADGGETLDWSARRTGDRGPDGEALAVTRRLRRLDGATLLVLDRVEGEGPLPLELIWQAAPDLRVLEDEHPPLACAVPGFAAHGFTLVDGTGAKRLWLLGFAPVGLDSFHRFGDHESPSGWVSAGYDELEAAPCFGLRGETAGPRLCATALVDPGAAAAPSLRLTEDFRLEILRQGAEVMEMELTE